MNIPPRIDVAKNGKIFEASILGASKKFTDGTMDGVITKVMEKNPGLFHPGSRKLPCATIRYFDGSIFNKK